MNFRRFSKGLLCFSDHFDCLGIETTCLWRLVVDFQVSEGYADDCRNTDNAWVENTIVNIHLDRASQEMVDIDNMVGNIVVPTCNTDVHSPPALEDFWSVPLFDSAPQVKSHVCLQWQEVSGQIRLDSNHRDSLQLVAALHNTSVWRSSASASSSVQRLFSETSPHNQKRHQEDNQGMMFCLSVWPSVALLTLEEKI